MKIFVLQIIFLGLSSFSFCQKKEFLFTVQPYSTHLIDSVETVKILTSLEGFLIEHLKGTGENSYVDPEYLRLNSHPFRWFRVDTAVYKPALLSVLPIIESREFLITLSYIGIQSDKKPLHGLTYSIVAKKTGERYFFYNSIDYHTRNWNRKQIGSVLYIYPNKLNLSTAKKSDSFNKSFAKKLSSEVLPITYYKCDDPVQLFRIMGCDYIPNMYLSTHGGLAEANHTVFAGNNSEWYPHEFVHFYTNKFPDYNRIVHEGYATFVGGSGGISIEELQIIAKEYLKNNPNEDLTQMFVGFKRITKGIPFTYIASGLICREIENKQGFTAIKELFKAGNQDESYFARLEEIMGIKKNEFDAYLRSLIDK